jgi:hypothetical protein
MHMAEQTTMGIDDAITVLSTVGAILSATSQSGAVEIQRQPDRSENHRSYQTDNGDGTVVLQTKGADS